MKISNNVVAVLIVLFMLTSIYANYAIVKEGERRMTEISGQVTFGRIRICINHAPYIYPIPPLNATVGNAFVYQVNASDTNNNSLTFGDNEILFDIDPVTGIINFTPEFISIGTHYMTVWVDDNEGCLSSRTYESFYLTIKPPPRNWTNLTAPEGIFEPYNGNLSGTHTNTFTIRFNGLILDYSDVIICNIKQSDGSILPITGGFGTAIDYGNFNMTFTVNPTDSIINDPTVGYIPWVLKNCTLTDEDSNPIYSETLNSRIYVHDDSYWADNEITRAVSCMTAPNVYFNNTGHCEFLEDTLFALQMRNGNPVNESCFDEPGVACGDPYCNGIYFPTCDPISYFGGYSSSSDDPNNIVSFTTPVGSYSTGVWYTNYTNSSGSLKVRVIQSLNNKTFSIAISNLTNVSPSSNVYGGNLGGGTVTVADQGDGTWALTHKKLGDGFNGTLDFIFNVSFTEPNLAESRNIILTIAYGTDTNAGNPEIFKVNFDPTLGPSNNNESENTSIMIYGPVCADGANNDFDYLGAGGIWDYSYDCFDNNCDRIAGATQINEFGSGKTGLCNYAAETNCTDEYDNDYDRLLPAVSRDYTDCHDADCFNIDAACPDTETICNDNINNDWDYTNTDSDAANKIGNNGTKYGGVYIYNLTDCEDPDCDGLQGGGIGQLCIWGYETNCADSFDNDDLQLKDCDLNTLSGTTDMPTVSDAEYDCSGYCRATNTLTETGALCDNNLDDDYDAVYVTDYYSGSENNSYGAGTDCRWIDYNPDEDCNMTTLSNGKICELQFELTCNDEFDNDYDSNASGMPHAGWGANTAGYLDYFGFAYSNDADYDDYDCKIGALAPSNESLKGEWCFDTVDNDLDAYYWNGSTYRQNSSTGADCYDQQCKGVVNPNNLTEACLNKEYDPTSDFFLSLTYPGMYCDNGLDDDVDGPIDCLDSDCNKQFDICSGPCYETEAVLWNSCKDSTDNDYGDGTDCQDSDCLGMIGDSEGALCEAAETLCYDGFNNDAQGGADCLDHSDCDDEIGGKINNKSVYCRANENNNVSCFDGFDNDGNNQIDCYDNGCNAQCNLTTISGTSPITIPSWYGQKTINSVTDAYVDDYTRRIRKGSWYNITLRMTTSSSSAQWTLGAATGYGQFPLSSFNVSSAYLAGPNANDFTLTNTANGFIVDSNGANLPSEYIVSFLIKSNITLNQTDYELTYAENTGYKTSVNNQIFVEIVENVQPEAQLIRVVPFSGNLSYGDSVYLRANMSDNNQGICDWYVYGQAVFNPPDNTSCRGSFTPTEEGTYYINVTPVDYYSNIGTSISTTYELNLLPSSNSVTVTVSNRTGPFARPNETIIFNASFNLAADDSLGTCQVIAKDGSENETLLASFAATGNDCYIGNLAVSSLADGQYRILARVTETTESNIAESDTIPLFICSNALSGICQLVDFNGDDEADVCEANFPPNITGWYPTTNPNITEEQNQTFNITFEDPDEEDTIRVRWLLDGAVVKLEYNTSVLTSNYSFIGDYLNDGDYNVTVIVDDSEFFASHEWLLTVENVNRLPYFTMSLPNQTWDEDTSLTAFDLDDYSYDEDTDDNITFDMEYSKIVHSPISSIIDPNTHIVTFLQPANWFGNDTVYFTIDDQRGGTNRSNDIILIVNNVPEPQPPPPPPSVGVGKCKSQWYCQPWSTCYPEGKRYRQCVDLRECSFPTNIPETEQFCTFIPTCYDSIKNEGEDDVDCGGPCPPCWTCFDMIQNCHVIEGNVICEEGLDCGGPCEACANCFDGVQNQDEVGIDCGGICLVEDDGLITICHKPGTPAEETLRVPLTALPGHLGLNEHLDHEDTIGQCGQDYPICCNNGYRDIQLGEVGADCGGPCELCPIVQPAPPIKSRIRQIAGWFIIIALIVLLIVLTIKKREQILEAIYKFKLKKEEVVEEDIRDKMLTTVVDLEKSIGRKTRAELTKDVSNLFREVVKTALNIEYEFTHEELITELGKSKMDTNLKKIIMSFSEGMSWVKYGGYKLTKEEARSLLNEIKAITHLTTKKMKDTKISAGKNPAKFKNKSEELSYNMSEAFESLVKGDVRKAEEMSGKIKKLKDEVEGEKGIFNSQVKRLEREIKLSKKKAKETEIKETATKAAATVTIIFVMALAYLFLKPGITGLYTTEPQGSAQLSSIPELHLEIGKEFYYRVYPDPGREHVVFSDDTRLFSISKDGLLKFTPTEEMSGIHYVAIIAKDGTGWYDLNIVKFVIGEVTKEVSIESSSVWNFTDMEYERIAIENFANQSINKTLNLTNQTD